jgi:hypothetical protein
MPITGTVKNGFNTNEDGSPGGYIDLTNTATGVQIDYSVDNKQNNCLILRLNYSKGVENYVNINYARRVDPDTDFYYEIEDSGSGTIELYTQKVDVLNTNDLPVLIPIPKGRDDEEIRIIIEGDNGALATGTIEVIVTEDHFAS